MKAFIAIVYILIGVGYMGQYKKLHPESDLGVVEFCIVLALWPAAFGMVLANLVEDSRETEAEAA